MSDTPVRDAASAVPGGPQPVATARGDAGAGRSRRDDADAGPAGREDAAHTAGTSDDDLAATAAACVEAVRGSDTWRRAGGRDATAGAGAGADGGTENDTAIDTDAAAVPPAATRAKEVVLVTGISGSGKSVALHALEDAGFFCVDNLPPELLREFLELERRRLDRRVAIAVDVRSAGSLPHLLPLLAKLRDEGVAVRSVFIDASTDSLVRRFSETRRPHPLTYRDGRTAGGIGDADGHRLLVDAIELERDLLAGLRQVSTVIDTSQLRPAQLRAWIRDLVAATGNVLTLVFESFAFRHGVPLDADFVFDVRVLPNPHYIRELRPLSGRDAEVAAYLREQPEVAEMFGQIAAFLQRWLPAFVQDQRSYLTVAIGCTGGQHRSVYFVEALARHFARAAATLVRHRELDAHVG